MIRHASPDDIHALVALGRVMHAESPEYRGMRFCPDVLARSLSIAIAGHFAMVAERADGVLVGGLAAMAVPHFFGPDLQACDLGLFIAPDARGGMAAARLIRAYVEWARGVGARKIVLGITAGVDVEVTADLCNRLGARRSGLLMEFA